MDAKVRLKNARFDLISKAYLSPAITRAPKVKSIRYGLQSLNLEISTLFDPPAEALIQGDQGVMRQSRQLDHLYLRVNEETHILMDVIGMSLP